MGKQPDPIPSLLTRLRKIEEWMRRKDSASPFFGTGMHPNGAGGLDSDNFVTNVSGYRLAETPEFNDLKLRGGLIGNDALTNPVVPQGIWKGTTANFGLAVTWSNLVTQAVVVPAGASSVIVHGFVRLVASNTTASKDYLYSDLVIAGQNCGGFSTPVTSGDAGTSMCSFVRVMTGLTPGDTFDVIARGSTGLASWASSDNVCQISASVLFFR